MPRKYFALFAYNFSYYITVGLAVFISKLYGEVGLTNSEIGFLVSIPNIVALFLMPKMGQLSDRVGKKRHLLALWLAFAAVSCFLTAISSQFFALLFTATGYVIFSTTSQPLASTIGLEYCASIGKSYGLVRLMGTLGYQFGMLVVSLVLSNNLQNLYPLIGIMLLLSGIITFFLPNIKGHQHTPERIPMRVLFADRHVLVLYCVIFFSAITVQFYVSFYAHYMGTLGMSNSVVSWIALLIVIPEIPFLYFGDRLFRKTGVWNWLIVGMLLTGIRWLGLSFSRNPVLILLFQLPAVASFACFEFIPAMYLNRRIPKEMVGSAQSMLILVSFGAGRIIGGLLGGYICEFFSISFVFAMNGSMLILGALLLWKPSRRFIYAEAAQAQARVNGTQESIAQ